MTLCYTNASTEHPAAHGHRSAWSGRGPGTTTRTQQSWWPQVADQVRRYVDSGAAVDSAVALNEALRWLNELPSFFPQPTLGIAEDRAVSVEWDRAGNVLHVMFTERDAEVYFAARNGDEFETALDAGYDKVMAAIRTLATT